VLRAYGLQRLRIEPQQAQDRRRYLGGLHPGPDNAIVSNAGAGDEQRDVAVLGIRAPVLGNLPRSAGVDDAVLHDADDVRARGSLVGTPNSCALRHRRTPRTDPMSAPCGWSRRRYFQLRHGSAGNAWQRAAPADRSESQNCKTSSSVEKATRSAALVGGFPTPH